MTVEDTPLERLPRTPDMLARGLVALRARPMAAPNIPASFVFVFDGGA